MPKRYRITNSVTGETLEVDWAGPGPPTQQDAVNLALSSSEEKVAKARAERFNKPASEKWGGPAWLPAGAIARGIAKITGAGPESWIGSSLSPAQRTQMEQISPGRRLASGITETISGISTAAAPLLPAAFMTAPARAALGLGAGIVASQDVPPILEKLGTPPEYAELGGVGAGLVAGTAPFMGMRAPTISPEVISPRASILSRVGAGTATQLRQIPPPSVRQIGPPPVRQIAAPVPSPEPIVTPPPTIPKALPAPPLITPEPTPLPPSRQLIPGISPSLEAQRGMAAAPPSAPPTVPPEHRRLAVVPPSPAPPVTAQQIATSALRTITPEVLPPEAPPVIPPKPTIVPPKPTPVKPRVEAPLASAAQMGLTRPKLPPKKVEPEAVTTEQPVTGKTAKMLEEQLGAKPELPGSIISFEETPSGGVRIKVNKDNALAVYQGALKRNDIDIAARAAQLAQLTPKQVYNDMIGRGLNVDKVRNAIEEHFPLDAHAPEIGIPFKVASPVKTEESVAERALRIAKEAVKPKAEASVAATVEVPKPKVEVPKPKEAPKSEVIAPEIQAERKANLLRTVHAEGARAGLRHSDISERAQKQFNVKSLSELDESQLRQLLGSITEAIPKVPVKPVEVELRSTREPTVYEVWEGKKLLGELEKVEKGWKDTKGVVHSTVEEATPNLPWATVPKNAKITVKEIKETPKVTEEAVPEVIEELKPGLKVKYSGGTYSVVTTTPEGKVIYDFTGPGGTVRRTISREEFDRIVQRAESITEVTKQEPPKIGPVSKPKPAPTLEVRMTELSEKATRTKAEQAELDALTKAYLKKMGHVKPPKGTARDVAERFILSESGEFRPAEFVKAGKKYAKAIKDIPRPLINRIRSEGDAGDILGLLIEKARNLGEHRAGQRVWRLQNVGLPKLTREEKFNLLDVLEGRASPMNRKVADNALEWRAIADEVATSMEELHGELRVPSTGERLPFSRKENYYPHAIPNVDLLRAGRTRADVIENLVRRGIRNTKQEAESFLDDYVDFIDKGGRKESLIQYMRKTNQAKTSAEALEKLHRFRGKGVKREGHLEYVREVNLPFYDPDPSFVLPQYAAKSSIRLEQIRHFGQDNQVISRLIRQVDKAGGDSEFLQAAVDRILGFAKSGDTSMERASRLVRTIQGFKLGLAAIPNAAQGALNGFLKGDAISALYGTARAFTKPGRDFALKSGANMDSIIQEAMKHAGASGRLLGGYLKATGFSTTERFDRVISANIGAKYTQRLLKKLQSNPSSNYARTTLEKLGIDPDSALRRGITADDVYIAAKKFSDATNFRSQPQDIPFDASTPLGKVLFQFKNYIYGQTRLVYQSTVGEIQSGNYGRAVRNLLVLGTVFPLTGEAIADVRALATGRKRTATGLQRYFENIAQVGGGGVLLDAVESGKYQRGTEFVVGPGVSDIGESIEVAGAKDPFKAFMKFAVRRVPFIGQLTYNRIYGKDESEKSKTLPRVRRPSR